MSGMIDWQTDDEIIDNLNEKISTLKAKLEEKDAEIERLRRECIGQGSLIKSGVFIKSEEYSALIAKLEKAEAALEKLISAVEMVPFRDVYQDINEAKEALKELRGERAR